MAQQQVHKAKTQKAQNATERAVESLLEELTREQDSKRHTARVSGFLRRLGGS